MSRGWARHPKEGKNYFKKSEYVMDIRDKNDIYTMELHDEIHTNGWTVIRVAGGWIYQTNREASEIFVPYDNEFQQKEE